MTQANLDALHAEVQQVIDLWINRLVTDRELMDSMRKLYEHVPNTPTGFLDPNTGLRY